jgi:hypothetical protein
MVGARQSLGSRVQYASRLPWSLPHALDDVMESVLTQVRDGNTALLTHLGRSVPQPFSRELVAVKGSREPYAARMVPYFDSTDHHAFNSPRVGVPATSLTNWPDELIHGTGDDLESVDATQLERNALVVAAVALYFANLADEDVPALSACVAARAQARVASDLATAVAHLASAAPADRDAAFREARNLVRQSPRREMAALASIRRLAPKGRATELIAQASERLEEGIERHLEAVERAYVGITGKNPPSLELTAEHRDRASKVFVPVTDLGPWRDALARTRRVDGLHRVMEFETLAFADGRRTAWDVFEAVSAGALSAGGGDYGRVAPAAGLEVLNRAAKEGAFSVRAAR